MRRFDAGLRLTRRIDPFGSNLVTREAQRVNHVVEGKNADFEIRIGRRKRSG